MNFFGNYFEGLAHSLTDIVDEAKAIFEGISGGSNMEGPPRRSPSRRISDYGEKAKDGGNNGLETLTAGDFSNGYMYDAGRKEPRRSTSFPVFDLDKDAKNGDKNGPLEYEYFLSFSDQIGDEYMEKVERKEQICSRLYMDQEKINDNLLMEKLIDKAGAKEDVNNMYDKDYNGDKLLLEKAMISSTKEDAINSCDLYGVYPMAVTSPGKNNCASLVESYDSDIVYIGSLANGEPVGSNKEQIMDDNKAQYGYGSRKDNGIYVSASNACMLDSKEYHAPIVESCGRENVFIGSLTAGEASNAKSTVGDAKEASPAYSRNEVCKFVDEASATYHKLKKAIKEANDMLDTANENQQLIPSGLMAEVAKHLIVSPGWCLSALDEQDKAIESLQRDLYDSQQQYTGMLLEYDQLRIKYDKDTVKAKGLSSLEQRQIEALGAKDVLGLVNRYRVLQIEVDKLNRAKLLHVDSRPLHRLPSSTSLSLKQAGNSNYPGVTGETSKDNDKGRRYDPIPMPEKFNGKSRVDLDRWLRYFDQAVNSRNWSDKNKATVIGCYVPSLQFTHDRLMKKNASYEEVKIGLLNALGTDSSVAQFTLRTSLDRFKKGDKMYRNVLEDVERSVAEAFCDDSDQGEAELKKILIRLTQEDPNHIFSTTIIPHLQADYNRLKELVLGVEASLVIKQKAKKQRRRGSSSFNVCSSKSTSSNSSNSEPDGAPSIGSDCESDKAASIRSKRGQAKGSQSFGYKSINRDHDGRKPLICFKCSKANHYSWQCPENVIVDEGRPNKNYDNIELNGLSLIGHVTEENGTFFGRKPVIDVWLDEIKVKALLDSGACASVISDRVIGMILRQRPKGVRKIFEEKPESWLNKRLIGANGVELDVVNCVRMPIAWGSYPSKMVKFFVVRGLQQDVLIGTNVLQNDKCWIEALGIALGGDPTNANAYWIRRNETIGLIMPQNDMKRDVHYSGGESCKNRDRVKSRGYGIDADSWRRGIDADSHRKVNATTCGKHEFKEKKLIPQHERQKKKDFEKQNNHDFKKKKQNDRGKQQEMLNGRRVFYNTTFYRDLMKKKQADRAHLPYISNVDGRTSNVRGNSWCRGLASSSSTRDNDPYSNRGYKRKVESWQEDAQLSRDSQPSGRRHRNQQ